METASDTKPTVGSVSLWPRRRLLGVGRVCPFDEAQTTAGGVKTAETDPFTMQSLKTPGLYFTGEIMDVTGICGGYNLQWAWSTAYVAAKALSK